MIRKLVAWDDFSKVATLNLHDKATRDEIFLTICDVNANNFSFSQEYTSFSSKAVSADTQEKRRYCKTLELSSTQKVIFTAGIS